MRCRCRFLPCVDALMKIRRQKEVLHMNQLQEKHRGKDESYTRGEIKLIAMNDVAAYFVGFYFEKTPLIKLSPKKTWEGFIGASVATTIYVFLVSNHTLSFDPLRTLSFGLS
ncbi:hypothetical protein Bca4012_034267 [Brassica carinata]